MLTTLPRSIFAALVLAFSVDASAQSATFEPTPGQAGKDVVWVPTPPELVEKMLDMAKVTPQDIVMDLGSGDGRNVIAAAKRGARAIGFEYNPDMVALSRRLAQEAGVADRATFVEGDMYEADISKATVLALFLLPQQPRQARAEVSRAQAGHAHRATTRSTSPAGKRMRPKRSKATAPAGAPRMLNIVPAQVAGTWQYRVEQLDVDSGVSDRLGQPRNDANRRRAVEW